MNQNKTKYLIFFILFLCFLTGLSLPSRSAAIETAPRISDREIIESLTEIKANQKAIIQRFEQVDKRFEEMKADMNSRFEQVDKRFEDMRLFFGLIITLIIALLSLIIALFGFIVWDRRTFMKPVSEKIESLETDLEIKSSDGSMLRRLISAFRELAKEDQKVANVLRQFHLL